MPIAIIYGSRSKSVRRIIVDSNEKQLLSHVGKGEDIIVVTEQEKEIFKTPLPDLKACEDLVEARTGEKPQSTRCVVLNSDLKVLTVVMADPFLDQHPDGDLIRDQKAQINDELRSDGQFYRKLPDGREGKLEDLDVMTYDGSRELTNEDIEAELKNDANLRR